MIRVEFLLRRRELIALASWAHATLAPEPAPIVVGAPIDRREYRLIRITHLLYRLLRRDGTCLRESLVAARLLQDRDCVLHIGVRSHDGAVSAHAWVTVDGATWDGTAPHYVELTGASRAGAVGRSAA